MKIYIFIGKDFAFSNIDTSHPVNEQKFKNPIKDPAFEPHHEDLNLQSFTNSDWTPTKSGTSL